MVVARSNCSRRQSNSGRIAGESKLNRSCNRRLTNMHQMALPFYDCFAICIYFVFILIWRQLILIECTLRSKTKCCLWSLVSWLQFIVFIISHNLFFAVFYFAIFSSYGYNVFCFTWLPVEVIFSRWHSPKIRRRCHSPIETTLNVLVQ